MPRPRGGGIDGSLLYQGNTAFGKTSTYNVFRSPLFLVPASLLVLNVLFCVIPRLREMPAAKPRTWSFAGLHIGLLLLAAGLAVDGVSGFVVPPRKFDEEGKTLVLDASIGGSRGGKINGNRIANREWDVKIGEWAAGDLDLSGNFWGAMDGAGRPGRIRDYRERKHAGTVVFDRTLTASPPGVPGEISQ